MKKYYHETTHFILITNFLCLLFIGKLSTCLNFLFSVRLALVFFLLDFLSSPLFGRSDQFSGEKFLFTESLDRLCLLLYDILWKAVVFYQITILNVVFTEK